MVPVVKPHRKARCLIQLHKDVTSEIVTPMHSDSNGALMDIWSGISSARRSTSIFDFTTVESFVLKV